MTMIIIFEYDDEMMLDDRYLIIFVDIDEICYIMVL